MIKEADKNGDGEIDYSEFIDMMDKLSKSNWFYYNDSNNIVFRSYSPKLPLK